MIFHRQAIAGFAKDANIPSIFGWKPFVDAGGLMSYGPNLQEAFSRLAFYADKILRGAKPAELPVEQPTKFELVINLKTAKRIGVVIPQSVLNYADRVIE